MSANKHFLHPHSGLLALDPTILSFTMDEGIRMFVLQKHSARFHTYVGDLKPAPNTPPTRTVESLTETVRHYIKSRPELKSWGEDVDDIDFVVHKVRRQQTPSKPLNRCFVRPVATGDAETDGTAVVGDSQH